MVDMKVTNQALPQGVPNGLTELQKMLTNITDEIAVSESLTGYMTPNPLLVQAAQSSGSFKISTSKMSGLGDYSRFKGSALGAVTNTWEEYKCRYDRARSFVLDNVDVMTNDGLISASSALSQFMREEVVPELDATRIATCAQTAITATSTVEKAPAKASFLTDITTGMNAVKKALKLRTTQGMKIHVSDKYIDILEGSSEFNRTKDITAEEAEWIWWNIQ